MIPALVWAVQSLNPYFLGLTALFWVLIAILWLIYGTRD
jgi:hypothetical protein